MSRNDCTLERVATTSAGLTFAAGFSVQTVQNLLIISCLVIIFFKVCSPIACILSQHELDVATEGEVLAQQQHHFRDLVGAQAAVSIYTGGERRRIAEQLHTCQFMSQYKIVLFISDKAIYTQPSKGGDVIHQQAKALQLQLIVMPAWKRPWTLLQEISMLSSSRVSFQDNEGDEEIAKVIPIIYGIMNQCNQFLHKSTADLKEYFSQNTHKKITKMNEVFWDFTFLAHHNRILYAEFPPFCW